MTTTLPATFAQFREIWCIDWEYQATDGSPPVPVCVVAHEVRSGRTDRVWCGDSAAMGVARGGDDVLVVAYFGTGDLQCMLVHGWPLPPSYIDLYAEFRNLVNGTAWKERSLLGAATHLRLPAMDESGKAAMRSLVIRGGPFDAAERKAILGYCEDDVRTTVAILLALAHSLDVDRALLRGRYVAITARIEYRGVPFDLRLHAALAAAWPTLKPWVLAACDANAQVFRSGHFSVDRLRALAAREGLHWPMTPTGRMKTDRETLAAMAAVCPALAPVRDAVATLAQLRLGYPVVGPDGRHRAMQSPFGTITGRNTPSTSKWVFGMPAWLRRLVSPNPGRALAYVDYEQQEFGIAAALSGDVAMRVSYDSGDPYLEFARRAGAVGAAATRVSASAIRNDYKVCALGVQYGMTEVGLAGTLGCSRQKAHALLGMHRAIYPGFWRWQERYLDRAFQELEVRTALGWRMRIGSDTKPLSVANFPMQANGSEMLRLACILADQAGLCIVATVHDAILIEASDEAIVADTRVLEECMQAASQLVLQGYRVRTEARIIRHGNSALEGDPHGGPWRFVVGRATPEPLPGCTRAPAQVHGCASAPSPVLLP